MDRRSSVATAKNKKPKKVLPDWLNHFNARDLKTLFKCSIAVWIAAVLMFINPVLKSYGQAVFFGPILLLIIPPTGVVFISVLGGISAVLGMAIGWAWGVITMKAALATRSSAETKARIAEMGALAARNSPNPTSALAVKSYAKQLIYSGFMLDTRVVVTYFCMLGLFIYFMARIKAAVPKLALTQLFAIIVADIFLVIGPLLPSFMGTIPATIIKPAATAIGIGLACNILFFPESTSHICLRQIEDIIAPLKDFLEAYGAFLEHRGDVQLDKQHIPRIRRSILKDFKALQANLVFLPLDLSFGYWNAEDIEALGGPLKEIIAGFLGMLIFADSHSESRAEQFSVTPQGADNPIEKVTSHTGSRNQTIMQLLDPHDRQDNREVDEPLRHSLKALHESSHPLLSTLMDTVSAILEGTHNANSRRWFGRLTADAQAEMRNRHQATLNRLRDQLEKFSNSNTDLLLTTYGYLFDKEGTLKDETDATAGHAEAFLKCLTYEERLHTFGASLEAMLAKVVILEEHRTKSQFWPSTKIRKATSWIFGSDPVSPIADLSAALEVDEEKKLNEKDNKSEAETLLVSLRECHRGKVRSSGGKLVLAITKWLGNENGAYALRFLIVTIAMALPAVIPSSAGFYYREKGMWGLIMAQTALTKYSSEYTYGVVSKILGTLIGGVVGMACWYIGAGSGSGNPYGLAAILAPVIVCLMWARLWGSPFILPGSMVMASTFLLVVGYSWDDTHIPSYGNPGIGYSVFWHRTVLVLIGFAAAAIVNFLPRPPSSARYITKSLSHSLRTNRDFFALLLAAWSSADRGKNIDGITQATKTSAIDTAETIEALVGPIALLKFEVSSNVFDSETLMRIAQTHARLNVSLAHMGIYTSDLPPTLRKRFTDITGAFNERCVGEIMGMMCLIEQTIKTGDPLPSGALPRVSARFARRIEKKETEALSTDMIRESGFRRYCIAIDAFLSLLAAIDDLAQDVKSAVGETYGVNASANFANLE
ncbi:uncharacterized protein K452DRAFT_349248 [Aplosporella prunicola CBS 121167]|uniref:ER transporter 6TM N-terminal domain-containing protein n=1 Tax=Aplosporella prunicola CBS 121167 TaxID=1176127 RepID=A0A6A6BP45_9PEZI|nr:uncharacterized protein K452DRAFT_349248 [Aplosporella prunicola CBS 121167]KAF2145862.1 hypothetical protein K452DRAFT_349248 [Aplosporella prunicola CBS 121167]